jgi:hypothetical protein
VPSGAFDQAVVLTLGSQISQTSAGFGVPEEYAMGPPGGVGMLQLQFGPLQVELQGVASPPASLVSTEMVPSGA